jgi:hypothetical protein
VIAGLASCGFVLLGLPFSSGCGGGGGGGGGETTGTIELSPETRAKIDELRAERKALEAEKKGAKAKK